MSGSKLRSKRAAANIPGHVVAARVNRSRAWLSLIENGVLAATPEELARIENAIDAIVAGRQKISEIAEREGLSLQAVGL